MYQRLFSQCSCTLLEKFPAATILFSDIVTFTNIAAAVQPMQIVDMLNQLYQRFDNLTNVHDVYKVKTADTVNWAISCTTPRQERG